MLDNMLVRSMIAIFGICGIAYVVGCLYDRKMKSIPLLPIIKALGLQIGLAYMFLKMPLLKSGLLHVCNGVSKLKDATAEGTKFVFGYIGGADIPFSPIEGKGTYVFVFQALPTILVINAIVMVLFHFRILPLIVRLFSMIFGRILDSGGALAVLSSAKIFLEQNSAPLVIKPYLSSLTKSEMFSVITMGMATASTAIILIYADILSPILDGSLGHFITVSIISVPGALAISRIMIPQKGKHTEGDVVVPYKFNGPMDAIATGAIEGMTILWRIAAILIVALALVHLTNIILGAIPVCSCLSPLSLEMIAGFIFKPLAWIMGVSWEQAGYVAQLLGVKVILNELVAYIKMTGLSAALDKESILLLTYALCGFGNISSIGLNVALYQTLTPERKDIISLAPLAMIAGTLASCLSGSIALAISRLF